MSPQSGADCCSTKTQRRTQDLRGSDPPKSRANVFSKARRHSWLLAGAATPRISPPDNVYHAVREVLFSQIAFRDFVST